ncbi:hypothetical protein [Humisphaera borealis]|uniref:Uncharacterized protein n=1 Tax=Humisphaera borealis TaxID=2807512 RepID=A0A7M2X1D3_9BACT|nr:hypothetical protein [Humisphaera borealis]QOV91495.1 hypothetical protein IPV69_09115 [Humisphaera borealis]
MKPALKLSEIEQEHLQELYNAVGAPRDELPYTPAYEQLIQDFQDRTFKNADGEQVFAALLKYGRSGSFASDPEVIAPPMSEEQVKQLKSVLVRHGSSGKLLPYSDAFNSARNEFNKVSGQTLSEADFWRSVIKNSGRRRPPPPRKKKAVVDDDDE